MTGTKKPLRTSAPWSAQPSQTPAGRESSPQSRTLTAMRMPQTVQTVPMARSGSFIATRPAKPMTKNSPMSVEAQSIRMASLSPFPEAAGPRRP